MLLPHRLVQVNNNLTSMGRSVYLLDGPNGGSVSRPKASSLIIRIFHNCVNLRNIWQLLIASTGNILNIRRFRKIASLLEDWEPWE